MVILIAEGTHNGKALLPQKLLENLIIHTYQ